MNRIYIILSFLIIALFLGCTKNFEEINTNPDYPTTSDVNYIFNYVTKEAAGDYGFNSSYNITYIQRWVMQTAAVYGNSTMPPYSLFDDFRITNLWNYYYSNLLLNCHVLVKFTADDENLVNKHNVARIWKVYAFHRVTDLWGDVPYSDAWKLLDEYSKESITPSYDPQESIYRDMLNVLKDAASRLDPSKEFYANDMIFGGDVDLWMKFANSLRLRLAIRSGNEQVVNEIITEGNLISALDEGASFTYIEPKEWWSPYYEMNNSSQNPTSPDLTGTSVPKVSELMAGILTITSDPRFELFLQPIETDNVTYRGVPNLMDSKKKENQALGMGVMSTSYVGRFFSENPTWTKQLLSYSEVCFLRAEAALRGWTSENPQQWYEEGVRAAMEWYEIPSTDIDAFLAGDGAWDNTLELLITEKWIALFLDGWEAFAEYRRTGFPRLGKYEMVLDGIKIKEIEWVWLPRDYFPGRVPFPLDEQSLNPDNYAEVRSRMGGKDDYYQQVWWSRKFGEIEY